MSQVHSLGGPLTKCGENSNVCGVTYVNEINIWTKEGI